MCQTNAYVRDAGKDEMFLEGLARIEVRGDNLNLTSIYGEKLVITGRILEINFQGGKLVMERLG